MPPTPPACCRPVDPVVERPPGLRWVEGMTADLMADLGIPGGAAVVVRGGEVVAVTCLGVAHVDTGVPVTPRTAFRVDVLTGSLVWVALARLAQAGRFDLDEPVSAHLPSASCAVDDPATTIRDLLTQPSAVPNVALARRWFPTRLRSAGRKVAPSPAVALIPGVGTVPGWERNLMVATGVLSALGGSGPDGTAGDVFASLHMDSTRLATAAEGPVASGHRLRPSRPLALRSAERARATSTPADLGRFLVALTARGDVLGPEMPALLLSPPAGPAASELGFLVEDLAGHRVARAGGGTPGFVAFCAVAPSAGTGVALLFNGNRFPALTVPLLATELGTEILGRLLVAPATRTASPLGSTA